MADERRSRLTIAVITALAGAWRVGYVVATKLGDDLGLNDSLYYSSQARQLIRGEWFRDTLGLGPGAEHGPLTAVVLAPVSWLNDPETAQRLVNSLLGTATVAVIALLTARLAGARAGVVAAVLAAVYPNLWMNDGLIMSESVTTLALVLCLWAAIDWMDLPTVRRGVLTGGLVALCALARSELALLAPLLVLVLVARHRRERRTVVRPAVAVLGAALVVVSPWVLFNLARFDRPVLLTTNDGTTLVGANCDATYRGPKTGSWSVLCVLESGELPGEDASERSARQRDEALAYVADNVDRVPVVVLARLGRSFDLHALQDTMEQDVGEERARWAVWMGIVMWWVLAPLAVVGLRRLAPDAALVLLVPAVVVVTTTVLFYGAHRIRTPLEPTVVVGAAVALVALAERRLLQSANGPLP